MSFFSMPEWIAPFVRCGFIGVYLFFFLSGFVLTLPYATAKRDKEPLPTWGHFISRRYLKIIPSYWLCIFVLQIVQYCGSSGRSSIGTSTFADLYTHLLFLHNLSYDTVGTISGVMWSLAPEVQFYAAFLFIVGPFLRWPIMTTVTLVSLANAWRIWLWTAHGSGLVLGMHQLPAFLDVFAAGMAAAYVYAKWKPSTAVASAMMVAGIVAFVGLIESMYGERSVMDWHNGWDVYHQTELAAAFVLTTYGALNAWQPLRYTLGNPLLVFLGVISYNLYLWHEPIAYALIWSHIPAYPFGIGDNPQMLDLPQWKATFPSISIAVSLAVATIVTYTFERPILRLQWRRT